MVLILFKNCQQYEQILHNCILHPISSKDMFKLSYLKFPCHKKEITAPVFEIQLRQILKLCTNTMYQKSNEGSRMPVKLQARNGIYTLVLWLGPATENCTAYSTSTPVAEKMISDGTDVPWTHRYFLASGARSVCRQ